MNAHSMTPADDVLAPLLSINDVAGVLGISRASVYTLIHSGELVPIRVGERARFDPVDVRDYLDRHRETTPEMREAGIPASEPLADENVNGHGNTAA
jgi:excisionase family DNA binding protein